MIMVEHFSLRRVTAMRVRTKNLCHLHKSPVEASGMFYHVALQKPHATTINPIGHLIAGDDGLLFPINQNLHPLEAQQSILLHYLPTHIVLLTRAATITLLNPHNLNNDARRMGRLSHRAGIIHGRLSNTRVPLLGGSSGKVGQSGDRRKGLFKVESFSSFN